MGTYEAYGKELVGRIGGVGGGHVIQNGQGTDMPQEENLQFLDSFLTDDSVNGRTVVENVKEVDPADYASTTDEEIIVTDDGDDALIGAVSDDYVEVTADGVKTYGQLLNELYALVDKSKLNNNSYIRQSSSYTVYKYASHNNDSIKFFYVGGSTNNYDINLVQLGTNQENSLYIGYSTSTSATAINNVSSTIPTDGRKITLYYGNKKAVVDLQTTANRCLYDSNTTVKQKIDAINDDIIVINDAVNLGDISANTGGYTSKALTIPSGYSIIALEVSVSSTIVTNGKLMLNGDFSGSTAYITYYSFMNLTSQYSVVKIRAICKKN